MLKICRLFEISRSGYYACLRRGQSLRAQRNQTLTRELVRLHQKYPALRLDSLYHILKSMCHTHTTMLIEAGISPMVVQERLGHKNIQTTLDIYAEVTDSMRDIAGNVIDQIYSK